MDYREAWSKLANNRDVSYYVKVKNLNGTEDKKCSVCGSWLKHWEHKSEEKTDKCCCFGCNNDAEVGAHVKIVGKDDRHHYIIPLCQACNMKTGELCVHQDVLVSARKCNNGSNS